MKGQKEPNQRQLRVGEEIRHALSRILPRADFRDPDLQDQIFTVTEVRISPDLKNATAFVLPLGGAESARRVAALNRANAFIRGYLGREVTLRFTPRLSFQVDHGFDQAERVENLLQRPRVQQDLSPPREDLD